MNLQEMMKQAQEMQARLQKQIAEMRMEASAGGGMVTVWAEPGRRDKAEKALQEAGFKAVRFRLDLRGLEVENLS